MSIFLLVFALFLLGACAVVSSPVPSTWGKRAFLFIVGATLWAGAIVLVRTNMESLVDFLTSDYALFGPFGAQVVATFLVFGAGWFVFVVTSCRTERKRTTQFDNLWGTDESREKVKVFRAWPGILVWIPITILLAAIWLVPAHLVGVDLEPTANPTPTTTLVASATSTSIPASTSTPTWTQTSTPESTLTTTPTDMQTPMPTNTPTATPTNTVTPLSSNPNMPPLACGGEWMHTEPFSIGVWQGLFLEVCPEWGFILHDQMDLAFRVDRSTLWEESHEWIFEAVNDGVTVNGQPFTEWLRARGGR